MILGMAPGFDLDFFFPEFFGVPEIRGGKVTGRVYSHYCNRVVHRCTFIYAGVRLCSQFGNAVVHRVARLQRYASDTEISDRCVKRATGNPGHGTYTMDVLDL